MPNKLTASELELVQRFYDYDLDESELEAFSERLEEDSAFAMEVERYNLVYHAVAKEVNQNRVNIKGLEGSKEIVSKKPQILKWLLLLLGIGSLIVGIFYFMGKKEIEEKKPNVLYAELDGYVSSMREDNLVRGEEGIALEKEQIQLNQIIDQYSKEHYTETIAALDDFIANSTNSNYQEMAYWEKAFVYADVENITKIKETLENISENSLFNSSRKAKKLLEKL